MQKQRNEPRRDGGRVGEMEEGANRRKQSQSTASMEEARVAAVGFGGPRRVENVGLGIGVLTILMGRRRRVGFRGCVVLQSEVS